MRSKSSTLSLHVVETEESQEGLEDRNSPPLQRRNSIHNVPFVDVNDPETRTRMERYKEERRSMLRAKYKAEDYFSDSYSRKKKLSTTSTSSSLGEHDTSTDGELGSLKRSKSNSPDASPEIKEDNESPFVQTKGNKTFVRKSVSEAYQDKPVVSNPINFKSKEFYVVQTPKEAVIETLTPIRNTDSLKRIQPYRPTKMSDDLIVSRKLVDLKQPEPTSFISRKSLPDNFDFQASSPGRESPSTRSSLISKENLFVGSKARPSDLQLIKNNNQSFVNPEAKSNLNESKPSEKYNVKANNPSDDIEDNVNVRERASIFGPRKCSEVKVRTVSSVSQPETKELKMRKISSANNPTSPSKIKNMAAIFEQKH